MHIEIAHRLSAFRFCCLVSSVRLVLSLLALFAARLADSIGMIRSVRGRNAHWNEIIYRNKEINLVRLSDVRLRLLFAANLRKIRRASKFIAQSAAIDRREKRLNQS